MSTDRETICGVEMPEPDLEHACYRPGKQLQGTEEFAYTADQLRETVAAAGARERAIGYAAGKTRARLEVLGIVVVAVFLLLIVSAYRA